MLLHTKLVNVFGTGRKFVKIDSQIVDTRVPSITGRKQKKLFEGDIDIDNFVSIIESEVERLESICHEPFIMVFYGNEKFELHQPKENILKSERHIINIYFT